MPTTPSDNTADPETATMIEAAVQQLMTACYAHQRDRAWGKIVLEMQWEAGRVRNFRIVAEVGGR